MFDSLFVRIFAKSDLMRALRANTMQIVVYSRSRARARTHTFWLLVFILLIIFRDFIVEWVSRQCRRLLQFDIQTSVARTRDA